jgi:hypothetical protein
MPIVACPRCGNPVDLPAGWGGTAFQCPHCRNTVSAPSAPPPPESDNEFAVDDPEDDNRRPMRRVAVSGSPLWDFLTFRLMITPIIIQIQFWGGVILCVGQALMLIRLSLDLPNGRDTWGVALGVAMLIFGPLVLRILCELDIILFKIHDELKETNDRQRYRR